MTTYSVQYTTNGGHESKWIDGLATKRAAAEHVARITGLAVSTIIRRPCDTSFQRNWLVSAYIRRDQETAMASKTIAVVRRIVGRKTKITKAEMGAILMTLAEEGLDLRNPYLHETMEDALAASTAWVKACQDIICISVSLDGYLLDGQVRYDQPGSMHPMQHAEITFAPDGMSEHTPGSTYAYLRQHCDRLLIVRPEPEHPLIVAQQEAAERAAEEAKYTTCECDNGHKWRTDDPQHDWKCPQCGEPWV